MHFFAFEQGQPATEFSEKPPRERNSENIQPTSEVSNDTKSGAVFNPAVTRIAYAYLMRVPIMIGLVLFLFPFVALFQLRSLLQNLFVLTIEGTVWTTALSLGLCWSILLTSRLVRLNGERFGLPQSLKKDELKPKSVFFVSLIAAPLVVAQFIERRDFRLNHEDILWRVAAVIGGAIIAYILAFIGLFLTVWVAPPGTSPADKTFPAPEFLRELLTWADKHGMPKAWLKPLGNRMKGLPKGLWKGYLDPETGLLWAGHWLAFTFALSIGLLTITLDLYRRAYLGEASKVPALSYLMILLLDLNWILAFLAFLLDRYRLPLIVPLTIICVIGANVPSSDDYYSSQSGTAIRSCV
jgi:hypothetical protein